jgi:hypothetical protein
MLSGSYVVHLVGCDDPIPFKHFRLRADAVAYGQSRVQSDDAERADVYLVDDATDARVAVAAFQMGKASYVQSCTRHASVAEIEAAIELAWEAARKGGPQTLLKFLGLPFAKPLRNTLAEDIIDAGLDETAMRTDSEGYSRKNLIGGKAPL